MYKLVQAELFIYLFFARLVVQIFPSTDSVTFTFVWWFGH